MSKTGIIGWLLLIASVVVGFGMTVLAPV